MVALKELPLVLIFEPHILIFDTFAKKHVDKFRFVNSWDYSADLSRIPGDDTVTAVVGNGSSPVTKEAMAQLPTLRMIANVSVGYNNIDLKECRSRGISVTNATSMTAGDVAEISVGLLLNVLRKTLVADRFVRQGRWLVEIECPLPGSKLGGKRVGIVGLGNIGTEIAKRLEAFSCKISYTLRLEMPDAPYTSISDAEQLASQNDVLIICCALSNITYHLIDKNVLLALGKHGVIINVGRGAAMMDKKSGECLVNGEIAGAGLDVFDKEPNVPKELLELDNVLLSPHGSMYTAESFSETCELVMSNLEAFFSNKPFVSPIFVAD